MKPLLVAFLVALLFSKLMPDITREVADDEYDFIVVGAGTTGCVVASRLSEDENTKVLLLEAGVSDAVVGGVHIPGLARTLQGTKDDWNYTLAPQKGAYGRYPGRVGNYVSGKVLGGTSSFNYMAYARGSPHDFDSWEDLGAEGWNFKSVEPLFRKAENAKSPMMSTKLGRNGPLHLSRNHLKSSRFLDIVMAAANEIGIESVDYIDNMEGLSPVTRTVFEGLRQSASTAYLRQKFSQRKGKLHILTEAFVAQILTNGSTRAYAVKYTKGGKEFIVRARKEIILSAGVFGSPQLLMLSGIGPKAELQKFNISIVKDLPGVGSNLQDHMISDNTFVAENVFFNITGQDAETQFATERTGRLAESSFLYLGARSPYFDTPTSVSTRYRPFPDVAMVINGNSPDKGNLKITFHVFVTHPKSRGTVKLRSSDVRDLPIVDPNYFSHEDDVKLSVSGSRIFESLEKTQSFIDAGIKYQTVGVCNGTFSQAVPRKDEFYRCMIDQEAKTMSLACCTAKIGRQDDHDAVVDSELRVYGIEGLRVADASVMPRINTMNLQAACYMIGEKAAEMIKKKWKLK